MVEPPREASSGGCISPPIKEVLLPRIEISSPAGSITKDAQPISEVSSYSASSCVIPDVREGYLACDMLKPDGGAVFVHFCSFLLICRDLLAIVTISSSLSCARV